MINWTTADGRVVPIKDLTHQHLSNIYWYHKIFQDIKGMPVHVLDNICHMTEFHLQQRFNGEKLSYLPHFTFEIDWLNSLNLIKQNTIYDKWGHEIGKVLTENLKHID